MKHGARAIPWGCLESYGVPADDLRVGTDMSDEEAEQAVKAAEGYKQIVVATYTSESRLPAGQQKLVNKLAELEDVALVIVATRNPYDINDLPRFRRTCAATRTRLII